MLRLIPEGSWDGQVRKKLPGRRHLWTQKVKLEGSTFYLGVGEDEEGNVAEIFLDAHKQGTFARGILDALARMVSVALQCGTPLVEVVKALKGLSFPPQGMVTGSEAVATADSLADWVGKELEAAYLHTYEVEDGKGGTKLLGGVRTV